jgi:predicted Zn finger-like uncharacterized protein
MKIVCPHCQAAYQVDIPGLKTKDVDVKCARCKSKFIVKKHGSDEEENSPEQSVDALAGAVISGTLAGKKDTVSEAESVEPSIPEKEASAEQGNDLDFDDDNKLDDYLDKILEEELGSPDPEAIKAQSSTDIDSTIEEVDKDLDSLLNDLIDEGLQTDLEDSSDKKVEPPAAEDSENYSEDLLGDIMSEEQQVESAPPSTIENQEAKVLTPEVPLEEKDATSQPEVPSEKEATPPEEAVESTQEAEQENPVAVEENTVSTKETPVEEKPAEEKSDEDLWAEAFADQKPTEQSAEKEATPPEEAAEPTQEAEQENPVAVEEDTVSAKETPVEEKPGEEKSDEDLWAEAFADQKATEQSAEKEAAETSTVKEDAPEATGKSEEELWAEAFAEQENLNESLGSEEEPAESTVSEPPAEEKEKETKEEEKNDEDLWAEAFADQEATEQSAEKADNDSETPQAEDEPETAEATEQTAVTEEAEVGEKAGDAFDDMDDDADFMAEGLDEEEEEELPEDAYSDDYNEADFEFKPKRKIFSIPKTRTGKIIMAGSLMAILLTAGGVYFTLQTFAPAELAELEKAETLVPEGLTPNESGEAPPVPEQNAQPTPDSITAEDTGTTAIEQELAQSEKLRVSEATIKDVKSLNNIEALEAALSPRGNTVTIQTIMPVAYNINDIRVLSFNLEVVMDNDKTADVLRDALPVFEQLTLEGVEQLLHKKFYNDVLYVKEKLQKKIRNDINAKLEGGGHVKKVKFKEFSIQ